VPQTSDTEAAPSHCTLYHRDAEFTALAEAELLAVGGGHPAEPGVWLSPVPIRWARCGYGSAGGRQLAFAPTLDELEPQLRALGLAAPRFSLTIRRIPQRRAGATEAKVRIADCIAGRVSADDPLLRLLVIVSPLGFRVLVDEPMAPGEDDWLRASHKPNNYLVALPVRIAKAMLNLTARAGDTVLDPFCGSGTIPLLAAWAGHPAFGSDVSGACVTRARENVAHFGQAATLVCADAREATQAADCILTNLPYGLYSHFAGEALRATLRNLARLAPRVTLVTSERIEDALRAEGYDVQRIIPVESYRFERLVYVTRAPASVAGR
jgi:predicted RNA methylase